MILKLISFVSFYLAAVISRGIHRILHKTEAGERETIFQINQAKELLLVKT